MRHSKSNIAKYVSACMNIGLDMVDIEKAALLFDMKQCYKLAKEFESRNYKITSTSFFKILKSRQDMPVNVMHVIGSS